MTPDPAAAQSFANPASPFELFTGFALIGIIGFGGVMPWVRWLLVERRGWCDEVQFTSLFAMANFLPGGNVVNVAILLGSRKAGLAGALAALTGLVFPPATIVCVLGGLYLRFQHVPQVQSMLGAMAAAAAGLVLAMGLRMLWPLRRSLRALIVIALVVLAATVLRLPLPWTLMLLLPTSLIAARLFTR